MVLLTSRNPVNIFGNRRGQTRQYFDSDMTYSGGATHTFRRAVVRAPKSKKGRVVIPWSMSDHSYDMFAFKENLLTCPFTKDECSLMIKGLEESEFWDPLPHKKCYHCKLNHPKI